MYIFLALSTCGFHQCAINCWGLKEIEGKKNGKLLTNLLMHTCMSNVHGVLFKLFSGVTYRNIFAQHIISQPGTE